MNFPLFARHWRSLIAWSKTSLLLFLTLGVALPCAAESLASTNSVELPPLTTTAALSAVVVLEDRPVALTATEVWVLDSRHRQWTLSEWQRPIDGSDVLAVAGDGQLAFLLSGHGDVLDRVEQLKFTHGALGTHALPPLPLPLRHARGTLQGDVLSLVGIAANGESKLLQILSGAERSAWQVYDGWPGDELPISVVAQKNALYLSIAGPSDSHDQLLRWTTAAGWEPPVDVPGKLLAASGRAMGQAHVIYLVEGAGGKAAQLMTFQVITGSWAVLPGASPTHTVAAAAWKNGVLWAQPSADGRQLMFEAAVVASGDLLLRWLDWVVIVVYLTGMIGIGLYFYLGEKRGSTSDFFVGGRNIPFWAAGISLYATNASSISFIAIPAKAFETNWQYLTNNLIAIFGLMFVAVWIVPLLRRLDLMSVFSYLETRFHPAIRMLASALCIVMQIGSRMSVILFLPALAIATITGIDVVWSVLIMGVFTILYTTLGGMKAVIWTDFVQVFVMFGGALFAIGFIISNIDGGVPAFFQMAMADDKMHLLDFSFDLTKATVWGFIFLVLFDVVLTFPKDQVLMQRILSTRSDKEASRSVWTFAAMMLPGGFVFYLIGTALFVYYQSNPERMNPTLPIDATFPLFIAAELPMGITGLIIAAIFAAAMSTLSSIINSVSTLVSVDFYEKLAKQPTPKQSVLFAEITGVVVGLVAMGLAVLLSRYSIHSLFDLSIELAGLLGGGFAGAYTLGMFTRRANAKGVAIGIGSSICLTLVAWWYQLVHPYFYLAISIMLCIVIGYLASLCFPASERSLKGLTIFDPVG
ncbi:MAG: sodium:solute symporter [Lysobacter sp.]